MNGGIAEILESKQFPGTKIPHEAGQDKYYSQLAEFPGDRRAFHTSETSAIKYCESRGWRVHKNWDSKEGDNQ